MLAGATLTLQTLRHSFDFSYGARTQKIADTPQPPIEDPTTGRARARGSRSRSTPRRRARAARRRRRPRPGALDARRMLGLLWRAHDRIPR